MDNASPPMSKEQAFIKELYEKEPNLKTEGLENFDGYFVHWNEILAVINKEGKFYNESPMELLNDLVHAKRDCLFDLVKWAESRYDAEVVHRPDTNVHKKSLRNTWIQVISKLKSMQTKGEDNGKV